MPQLTAKLRTPWAAASALWSDPLATPWGLASALWSTGGAYTPPAAPPGGTPTAPSTSAAVTVPAAEVYDVVHTLQVTDLRSGAVLPVDSVSISTDRDSLFWSLRGTGPAELMTLLAAGEQPARVRVQLDGAVWDFLVENVGRARQHASRQVSVEGRSLAAAAGAPYEPERLWALDGDTTGAQIAAAANLFTGLDVQFELDDWPVPADVFSFNGTPLAVVQRVAEAAGGIVLSQRTGYGVIVRPRYQLLPNEWGEVAPDLELPLDVLDAESFRVADQPAYDGVVVTGQQQGVAALVRLAGTAGAGQAPMVSDPLITDLVAARQRGQSVLGRSGKQNEHTVSMPLVSVAGSPVVPDPGRLVRVMDSPPWTGMVTAVQVSASLAEASLTLNLERHTASVPGTVLEEPPSDPVLGFLGPLADITVDEGEAVDVLLGANWVNGVAPLRYTVRSGVLPSWLNLNESTGRLTGTAPTEPSETRLALRCTDGINSTADSNEFLVRVLAVATEAVVVRSVFDGTEGQTTGIANTGSAGGTWVLPSGHALSTVSAFAGGASLRLSPVEAMSLLTAATNVPLASGVAFTFEFRVRFSSMLATSGLGLAFARAELNLTPPGGSVSSATLFPVEFQRASSSTVFASLPLPTTVLNALITVGTWTHLAISVLGDGRTTRLFRDGVLVGSGSTGGTSIPPRAMRSVAFVGGNALDGASFGADGGVMSIDNARVRFGFAYTANFTPDATI